MFPHNQLGHPGGACGKGDEGIPGGHNAQWLQELSGR